ncbi:MAG: glycosyltransferase family 2 protein [Solirubrobacteraceae bacterium]
MTVVIPTYRRIEELAACLAGVRAQTRRADEVVVVVHASDDESAAYVMSVQPEWTVVRVARVVETGLVAALNCGLANAAGAIVAFLDDDAVPCFDWLERIVAIYAADARIAAVGGRDAIVIDGKPFADVRGRLLGAPRVGRIQWFGRMLSNHHLGVGRARDVDVLKGVNMSFRRRFVRHGFDERLRGQGAQVHSEMSICLPLRRHGLRVVYDPRVLVRHCPAPRLPGDERNSRAWGQISAFTHNETLQILDHFGTPRKLVFFVWALLIGTTASPGLAVLARELLARRPEAWTRFGAAQHGRLAAWRTHLTVPRRLVAAPQQARAESPHPATGRLVDIDPGFAPRGDAYGGHRGYPNDHR